MAINVTCECGKRFEAKDEYEGRRAICPSCRREFVFQRQGIPVFHEVVEPSLATLQTHQDELERQEPTEVSRRFWKDPVVVIGAAVPTLILAVLL